MDKKQEYLHGNGYVTIFADVKDNDDFVIVETDGGVLEVARKNNLTKKEDSYNFKRAEERANELRLITQKAQENLDKLASKVVDKALLDLASRLKFNAMFGKDVNGAIVGWAVTISDELKKLVKEKAPEIIKKDDIFG